MTSRVFRIKPKRVYWQTHIEAWQRSGLSQRAYCDGHRLYLHTFRRWLKMFEEDAGQKLERAEKEAGQKPERAGKRRKKRVRNLSAGKRSKAVQAFWAMHVEAWQWSGLSATAYAKAHHMTRESLLKWRDRLEAEPEGIDWQELVHPSARPSIRSGRTSSGASSAAKKRPVEGPLAAAMANAPPHDRRSCRRSFTDEEKLAIVLESEQPGASAAAVCRRHEIVTSMLFRWRVQFGFGKGEPAKLAAVRVGERRVGRKRNAAPRAVVLRDLLAVPDGMAAADLPDGRRVFRRIAMTSGSSCPAARSSLAEFFVGPNSGAEKFSET